ncbi:MAG: phosphonate metabolism protein PhnP [Woeseiaceae bacterium]
MRLKFIGTGNAAGVPVFGCDCLLCAKANGNKDFRRGPASALLEIDDKKYLIDAGCMDIAEKFRDENIDGIFLTHFHPDHVQGLFHLRWGKGRKIPVYCPPDSEGCADLYKNNGILEFHAKKKFESFSIGYLQITPLPLIHSKVTFGYFFEFDNYRIAYLTDTKGLPPKTSLFLQEQIIDLLIIDTSHAPGIDDKNHNNLTDSLLIHEHLNPTRTILTHISHDFDIWLNENKSQLPSNVTISKDSLLV